MSEMATCFTSAHTSGLMRRKQKNSEEARQFH